MPDRPDNAAITPEPDLSQLKHPKYRQNENQQSCSYSRGNHEFPLESCVGRWHIGNQANRKHNNQHRRP
ncbi:protein of unknown function (plasmid) [Cupriavidus taiwanensis]|uniref:Uncharacterized protein n=1 Tax=Cupriavidus taiwanensis TaxID=164546 RepID=A0A7Z7JEY7_9BURK|nr:protein of unknown function [Cupriavidus taiwanensis]SOZ11908.1 protein of unknown function [Cupriavidus taiwanensis]SOZ43263.1 protein of unknown function [Cupriavidus taiwanensis]SPC22509.1 protein of unknown function [Cupriavidus taiwanensis]SPD54019.1 protein of unknown function [Cupriavidus taiwanensis]